MHPGCRYSRSSQSQGCREPSSTRVLCTRAGWSVRRGVRARTSNSRQRCGRIPIYVFPDSWPLSHSRALSPVQHHTLANSRTHAHTHTHFTHLCLCHTADAKFPLPMHRTHLTSSTASSPSPSPTSTTSFRCRWEQPFLFPSMVRCAQNVYANLEQLCHLALGRAQGCGFPVSDSLFPASNCLGSGPGVGRRPCLPRRHERRIRRVGLQDDASGQVLFRRTLLRFTKCLSCLGKT